MQIKHDTYPHVVTVELVSSLITQMQSTPMPRVRDAARHQLYGVGVQLHEISQLLSADLEAGDTYLNQYSDEEQNIAPETTQWLAWLSMYQTAIAQLQRITEAIAGLDSDIERAA